MHCSWVGSDGKEPYILMSRSLKRAVLLTLRNTTKSYLRVHWLTQFGALYIHVIFTQKSHIYSCHVHSKELHYAIPQKTTCEYADRRNLEPYIFMLCSFKRDPLLILRKTTKIYLRIHGQTQSEVVELGAMERETYILILCSYKRLLLLTLCNIKKSYLHGQTPFEEMELGPTGKEPYVLMSDWLKRALWLIWRDISKIYLRIHEHTHHVYSKKPYHWYRVATISRLLKMIGLFWKRALYTRVTLTQKSPITGITWLHKSLWGGYN